jgi:predicted helicase
VQYRILAFINNHGFLDNPTFRGMRWHLLTTFDKIYIIDLHGNAKKKEVCPDGAPDENVFDIQQGVSINIFIKSNKRKKQGKLGKVFHYDLYGVREFKYGFLLENNIEKVDFTEVKQEEPLYFFTQKDFEIIEEYENGFQVNALFPVNSVGVITARDKFTISEKKGELISRIEEFISIGNEDARERYGLGKDAIDWKVEYAKEDLMEYGVDSRSISKYFYRPFDTRLTYYTGKSNGFHCRPREKVMKHFINGDNIGLIASKRNRQVSTGYFFISKLITDFHILDNAQDSTSVFPLYLYEEDNTILSEISHPNRKPNLSMEIVNKIADKLGLRFTPEVEYTDGTFSPLAILDYIYAVLHSPSYREKYKEFLKIDFPRIPYPQDKAIFYDLVKLGGELRQIHLLESSVVEEFITIYPVDGTNEIQKVEFVEGKVWINDQQYFDNIPKIAWEFYIGGYQPAQKWLKDRKGRVLGFDDVRHYHKIIKALVETDRIMKEIDTVTADWI